MSDTNDGGPAFPNPGHDNGPGNYRGRPADGMTLRDYFAAKAMAAMIPVAGSTELEWHDFDLLAGSAYAQADAMLRAAIDKAP